MSVAGIAVLWRNWLEDHKNFKKWIEKYSGGFSKALTCGSCFTYWIALFVTLVVQPLSFWTPVGDTVLFYVFINILLQWMALSWLSVFLRFAYVALQELVNYQVHTLRNHDH